jgi:RNA polymerase sigma factor (TIGR02999 family)
MTAEFTQLLAAIERGDAKAADELLPLVYAELRALAARELAHERPGATLQATALVHEAYVRLVGKDGSGARSRWDGAGHFFAAAAESIRRILVEKARARGAAKRGGDWRRVTLDASAHGSASGAVELDRDALLDLDDALAAFAREEPRKARLVELRSFAGLTLEEAAELLGIAPATADRDWAFARAWLQARLAAAPKRPGNSANE